MAPSWAVAAALGVVLLAGCDRQAKQPPGSGSDLDVTALRFEIPVPPLPHRSSLPRHRVVLRDRFRDATSWRAVGGASEPSLDESGGLRFRTSQAWPEVERAVSIDASTATLVELLVEVDPDESGLRPFRLLWRREGDAGWDLARSMRQTVWPTRGEPRTLRFRVEEHAAWSGRIVALGFDPLDQPGVAVLRDVRVEDQPRLRRVVEEIEERGHARAGPGSDRRRAVPIVEGDEAAFDMVVPDLPGRLEVAFAVPESLAKAGTAPFDLGIRVATSRSAGEIAVRLDPSAREEDRGWQERTLPVDAAPGESVRVSLALRGDGATPSRFVLLESAARWIPNRRPAAPPSILLVTIDTWRADALGAAKRLPVRTETLDALAREGAFFSRCTTAANTTIPSHASILSSLWPRDHGLFLDRGEASGAIPTLADDLRRRGWLTGMAVSTGLLNLTRGEPTRWSAVAEGFEIALECPDYERTAPATNAAVLPWLTRHARTPFFVWIHYFDPHRPYEAPERFRDAVDPSRLPLDRIRDEVRVHGAPEGVSGGEEEAVAWLAGLLRDYLAEVARVDEALGAVLDVLRAEGILEETVVAVVGDHGESIFENGIHGNHSGYHEPVATVPLVLRGPGIPAGRRVDERVATVDLVPTLRALLGVEPPANVAPAGMDLAPLLAGEGPLPPRELFTHFGGGGLEGLVRYRGTRKEGMYRRSSRTGPGGFAHDLAADPYERVDLVAADPDRAQAILDELTRWQRGVGEGGRDSLSSEEEELLRALGYQ